MLQDVPALPLALTVPPPMPRSVASPPRQKGGASSSDGVVTTLGTRDPCGTSSQVAASTGTREPCATTPRPKTSEALALKNVAGVAVQRPATLPPPLDVGAGGHGNITPILQPTASSIGSGASTSSAYVLVPSQGTSTVSIPGMAKYGEHLRVPEHDQPIPAIEDIVVPDYIVKTGMDFSSLENSVNNTNMLTDSFNYRFQGIQSTLRAPPQMRVQTVIATAMTTVHNFCKTHISGTPQSDLEQTVAQRITALRVEMKQESYAPPSWEHWMELMVRKEGLEAQVQGLKGIIDSAYEFAFNARLAITQLLEEKAEARDFAIHVVENLDAVNRRFRDLSVEHDHLRNDSMNKRADYERKCQDSNYQSMHKNEQLTKLETEKNNLENTIDAANVTMNDLHLQIDSLVTGHNQACESSRQWKQRSEVINGQLIALSKKHADLTTWLDDNSDLITLGKKGHGKEWQSNSTVKVYSEVHCNGRWR